MGAFLLSFLGTVAPVVVVTPKLLGEGDEGGEAEALVFLGALVLGPSLGHFYAGRPGRAAAGIGIRTLSLAGLVGAAAASWDNPDDSTGELLGYFSLGVGAVSLLYDIFTAPRSATLYNEKRQEPRVRLSPVLGSDSSAPGLCMNVTF
jgi:hypothetical protein